MSVKELTSKKNPDISNYIENFPPKDVVLEDYYVRSNVNFFKDSNLYSDEELEIILNLTDKEYAELVYQYTNHDNLQEVLKEQQENDKKLKEFEEKIKHSSLAEDSEIKSKEYQTEIEYLENKINSVSDVKEKYEKALKEYSKYSYLKKFDLERVHKDLVSIINEMQELDQKILDYKVESIEASKSIEYNKGKIVFALSSALGIFLFGLILNILQISQSLVFGIWGSGLLLSFFLIYKSKSYKEDISHHTANSDLEILKTRFHDLKTQKLKILHILRVHSAEEFFHIKAELSSYSKSLEYLNNEMQRILEGENYKELLEKLNNLNTALKNSNYNSSEKLSPDEYLRIMREIDYLKAHKTNISLDKNLTKEEIQQKLNSIKNELKSKFPNFCEILKSTFSSNFSKVKEEYIHFTEKLNLSSGNIEILKETGDNYELLDNFQKVVVQYSLLKSIYNKDFVFGIINPEDKELLEKFANLIDSGEAKFYAINKI